MINQSIGCPVQIRDMRLLIFDEAHHAVKRHPYCMIMREFYHQAPRAARPRVFGMTASPVNIRATHQAADRIRATIYELEANLDAKVCLMCLLCLLKPVCARAQVS